MTTIDSMFLLPYLGGNIMKKAVYSAVYFACGWAAAVICKPQIRKIRDQEYT